MLLRLARGVLLAAAALLPALALGQAQEHEVKAAFLYKFPAFVEWPSRPGPSVPFVIAFAGGAEIAAELRTLTRGRNHEGRPIQVRDLEAQGVAGAHMVFVGRDAAARLPAVARAVAGMPVLLVSESPGALEQGSMINFLLTDGRVRFDVAADAAAAARLQVNARLLAVAHSVRGARP